MHLRTDLQIMLPRNGPGFYSTHDLIRGHISLEFKKDTVIDEVSVTLEGRASIRVEEHALLSNKAGYIVGDHTFLRLSHPVKSTDLPEHGVARGHRSYAIPFEFTVPGCLLPYVCSHTTGDDSAVRKAHLLPPPSLGNSKADSVFVNGMGPKATKVTYAINVQVRKRFRKSGSILLRKTRPVCVVPSRDEAPPIFVEKSDPYYRLSDEKDVYQGPPAISKAVGRLIAASAEPPAMLLHHPGEDISKDQALTAVVGLRFQAYREEPPPQLGSVTIKMHSFTFFGALPCETIPKPGDFQKDCTGHTQYMHATRLGSHDLVEVAWARQEASAPTVNLKQRPIRSKTADIAKSSDNNQVSLYTTSLRVPIRFPESTARQMNQKLFTPTFSSCILSRAYSLELSISYKAAASSSCESPKQTTSARSIARCLSPWSHLTLKVPLQIRLAPRMSSPARPSLHRNSGSIDTDTEQFDGGLDNLGAEQRPPAYTP